MGIPALRAPVLPRLLSSLLILGGALWVAAGGGCNSKNGRSKVSPGLFLAPFTDPPTATDQGGIIVRANKLDFLRQIQPTKLDSELIDIPAEAFVLGRLSSSSIDSQTKKPALTDDLLVYESQSGALLSVNLCPDASRSSCGKVRLNYNKKGLGNEQGGQGGVISSEVTPIRLKNGWILAFDSSSKDILAFREEEPRQVVDDVDGDENFETRTVPFRSAVGPDGKVNSASKNFGFGNGLLLSVVISGEETMEQLSIFSEPIVSRMVEIEENKVLVFFKSEIVRAVELLEIHEESASLDFDLDTLPADRPSEVLEVKRLRGEYARYPANLRSDFLPFLSIATTVTGDDNLILDKFQPIVIPDPGHPDPDPGVVLVYDENTSTFIRIGVARNPAGAIIGGTAGTAITQAKFRSVLEGDTGTGTVTPPFMPRGAFYNPSKHKTEIIFFEEKTRNILAYDYKASFDRNLRIFVSSADLLNRRDPRGKPTTALETPLLDFATADVNSNRLAFDQGLDQLVSVSYTSGVVVVVADVSEIGAATKDTLAEITYIEPLDDNNVRAFDSRTTSLIEFQIDYAAFPIRVQ